MKKFFHSGWGLVVIFLSGVLLDQFTKNTASYVVLNRGVSFGFHLFGTETMIVYILILAGFGAWWKLKTNFKQDWGFTLLFAGAMSNLFDRWLHDGVRDWLKLPLIPVRNNLADLLILLGLVGIIWGSFYGKKRIINL